MTFKVDLSDLSESQIQRLRSGGARPVVDCNGNAIGTAVNKRGAAIATLLQSQGHWNKEELVDLMEAVVEHDDCYVIGQPQVHNHRREADRVDGYDRDDLGESPDF